MANVRKLKILNQRIQRGGGTGASSQKHQQQQQWFCDVVVHQEDATFTNENLIVPNSYIMVTNPVIPNADQKIIRLQNSSKIYPTEEFPCDNVEDRFYNSELVTVAEAMQSPKKRRLSISGTVENVSPRKVGINWSRRDVTIADQTGSVVCKLWNTFDTLLDESNRSGEVRLNNLEVDKWGQDTSLKTTQETELQAVSNTEQNVLVEVLAQHGQQLLLVKPGSDDAEEVNVDLDVDIPDFYFPAVATVDINNGIISAFH